MIYTHVVPHVSGVDANRAMIRLAMGEAIEVAPLATPRAADIEFLRMPPGRTVARSAAPRGRGGARHRGGALQRRGRGRGRATRPQGPPARLRGRARRHRGAGGRGGAAGQGQDRRGDGRRRRPRSRLSREARMQLFDSLTHVTRDGSLVGERHYDASLAGAAEGHGRGRTRTAPAWSRSPTTSTTTSSSSRRGPTRTGSCPSRGSIRARCPRCAASRRWSRRLAAQGFAGIKLHPRLNGYDPLDAKCMAALDAAGQHGLVILLDTLFRRRGLATTNAPDAIDYLANACPDTRILLLHAAGPSMLELFEIVRGQSEPDARLLVHHHALRGQPARRGHALPLRDHRPAGHHRVRLSRSTPRRRSSSASAPWRRISSRTASRTSPTGTSSGCSPGTSCRRRGLSGGRRTHAPIRFDLAGHLYILLTLLFTVYGQLVLKWQMGGAGPAARRRRRQAPVPAAAVPQSLDHLGLRVGLPRLAGLDGGDDPLRPQLRLPLHEPGVRHRDGASRSCSWASSCRCSAWPARCWSSRG